MNEEEQKEYNAVEIGLCPGLIFCRTSLGEAVFIHDGGGDASNCVKPSEWTPDQLRKMADYMEMHPNCTIFSDGSGEPVRLT